MNCTEDIIKQRIGGRGCTRPNTNGKQWHKRIGIEHKNTSKSSYKTMFKLVVAICMSSFDRKLNLHALLMRQPLIEYWAGVIKRVRCAVLFRLKTHGSESTKQWRCANRADYEEGLTDVNRNSTSNDESLLGVCLLLMRDY